MQTTVKRRVAVVGAGIAGLSCATHLQALGFEVEVFEKSRGPSGRMSTRQGQGWSVDHGAQYFTARDPLFKQALDAWIADGIVGRWNPNIGVFEEGQWRESGANESRYVANPGMNAIGKHLASTLTLHLNQTIDQLTHINDQWQLSSTEAGLFISLFDFLVLALPAPQAAVLTKALPTEIQAICHSVNMDGCWTVMARFSERPKFPFDAAFVNGEKISWICRNQSKPFRSGKESWTIHASPKWSQENIELAPQEASIQLLACTKQLGLDCSDAEISVHRWRYASGFVSPSPEFIFLPKFNLGLCGDWLNSGRVEGAWLSGHKLAGRIENV
jgi:renalase